MQADQTAFFEHVSNLKKLIQLHRKNSRYDVVDYRPL
jgi:hypothetical protein